MTAAQHKYTNFYRSFEDRFRGTRESVMSRLAVYLPFVEPLKTLDESPDALDLGCGRGEWLELLQQNGFQAKGVDLDEGMLLACRELNLTVTKADALDYLKDLATESLSVVSAFHVVEHIPFEVLCQLVDEAYRVLRPGGLLILETPNSENLVVGTSSFYMDPTHQRPLPAQLLAFVVEYTGFERVKTLYLQEPPELATARQTTLANILNGVSPDYAVVAQKKAPKDICALFDEPFERPYGLRLSALADRYDQQIGGHTQWLEKEWDTSRQRIEELSKSTGKLEEQLYAANEYGNRLQEHVQWLQNGWDTAKQQIEELSKSNGQLEAELEKAGNLATELNAANEKNAQLQTHAQWLQSELDATNARLQAHAQWLQGKLDESNAKVHELNQTVHHWWTIADRLNQEQQRIYASTFWRITWPLRKLMRVTKWLLASPVRIIRWGIRLPKRMIKPFMVWVMRKILNNPGIKNRVLNKLEKYPQLKQHLRLFAMRSGLITGGNMTSTVSHSCGSDSQGAVTAMYSSNMQEESMDNLSPRAARIYNDLKKSIGTRKN